MFAAAASANYVTNYNAPPPPAQAPMPTATTALATPTLDAAFSTKDAYYATAMPSFGTGTYHERTGWAIYGRLRGAEQSGEQS